MSSFLCLRSGNPIKIIIIRDLERSIKNLKSLRFSRVNPSKKFSNFPINRTVIEIIYQKHEKALKSDKFLDFLAHL
jgi:hypothetical protein